ncbi:MAG: hypothetical protein OEU54_16225 [Gemmatimonadota bacterium]|nr:hypothetical protein [Gemmatimonadota bacterium]
MNRTFSIILVVLGGLAGLAFVFTDVLIFPPGPLRVAAGGAFYVLLGFLLARAQAGGKPFRWALACGWGTAILGLVGLWLSITDPGSGDFTLAMVFIFGPPIAAWLGVLAGRANPIAA